MAQSTLLAAGTPAPAFILPVAPDRYTALEDFRGRPLVLVFYPADWSPVCGDQLTLYSTLQFEFDRLGAAVVGISVDGIWCHAAFAESRRLTMPLLSDFEPKGAVTRRYGVYDERAGMSERALFLIDGDGMIQWSYRSPGDVNPGADGILEALERLPRPEAAPPRPGS